MEDEAPIIYGLEFPARALASQAAESETARFFVGTQSLKFENQIHQLDYEEETNMLLKNVFLHSAGEIWHLSASPSDSRLLSTCYNLVTPDGKCELHGAVWKLPADENNSYEGVSGDDSASSPPPLELVSELECVEGNGEFKSIIWEPVHGKKIFSLSDNSMQLYDLEAGSKLVTHSSLQPESQKGRLKFTSARWNPHHNRNLVATAIDFSVRSWDLRSMKPSWSIENAHSQLIRELDFNPNKQYYLATCGDDCKTRFWDVRNCASPLMVFSDHSHWVWSVRYNNFHDQLILTSSSDSRVILSRAISISSEPSGHMIDDEDIHDEEDKKMHQATDGVISVYEEHEDSVYAAEWSSADPWIFASLSYDGRLVVNKVPRTEKYKILI